MLRPQVPRKVFSGRSVGRKPRDELWHPYRPKVSVGNGYSKRNLARDVAARRTTYGIPGSVPQPGAVTEMPVPEPSPYTTGASIWMLCAPECPLRGERVSACSKTWFRELLCGYAPAHLRRCWPTSDHLRRMRLPPTADGCGKAGSRTRLEKCVADQSSGAHSATKLGPSKLAFRRPDRGSTDPNLQPGPRLPCGRRESLKPTRNPNELLRIRMHRNESRQLH
jgi:hypothetical protein